jgi:transketolase
MQTMRSTFAAATNDLLDSNPRLAVVLADIGTRDFAVSDRVVNVGIREQTLVGVTAGMALSGLRPIAHSYTPFLIERPFEQIKIDLNHQDLGAVLVSIGASYDAAAEGRTHQAPGDVALLSTLPDWTIHVPGHPDEVDTMLRAESLTDDRVYIRLAEDTNASPYPVTGKLIQIRKSSAPGTTVIAVGPMLDRVVAATEGIDATVLYASTVRPFDGTGLRSLSAGSDIIIVEPYLEGTSAGEIAKALSDRAHRVLSIGVPNEDLRRYGTRHHHAAAFGLDTAGLRKRINSFVQG